MLIRNQLYILSSIGLLAFAHLTLSQSIVLLPNYFIKSESLPAVLPAPPAGEPRTLRLSLPSATMPTQILPRTAAAFAPRAAPTIVLGTPIEPWLTAALKRSIKVKRPLNNVSQHSRCLADSLGRPGALWTLTSLILPGLDPNAAALESRCYHEMLHLQAYVVHVDAVSQNEIAFKFTAETITALITYHKDTYCINIASSTPQWPGKDSRIHALHSTFVNDVNRYVFRTDIRALEGLEEDGAGELLGGRAAHVKAAILSIFLPLEPPMTPEPTSPLFIAAPAPGVVPNKGYETHTNEAWWQSTAQARSAPSISLSPEPWQALPSTPSPILTELSLASHTGDDVLPFDWQQSTSVDQAQASPTPSLSRSVYSQGDQGLWSSPFIPPAMPSTSYPHRSPASHCVAWDDTLADPAGQYDHHHHNYPLTYPPQYAVSMTM